MLDQVFAGIAREFGAMGIGPYVAGQVIGQAGVTYDDGGSVTATGDPVVQDCLVQADIATEAMRGENGFADGDIRLLVLADGLTGAITTDKSVAVLSGPFAGSYSVESVGRDPAGVGFECRGRNI